MRFDERKELRKQLAAKMGGPEAANIINGLVLLARAEAEDVLGTVLSELESARDELAKLRKDLGS
jgi:hypothetical protein